MAILRNQRKAIERTVDGLKFTQAVGRPRRWEDNEQPIQASKLRHIHGDYLSRMIVAEDTKPEPVPAIRGYTHVSQLIGFCGRRQALQQETGGTQYPRSGDRIVWAIGKAVEKHVRDSIINARKFHDLLGDWECLCGDSRYSGLYDREYPVCRKCGTPVNRYAELQLMDHEYKVKGSPDLVLVESLGLLPVEIKSMAGNHFKELEAPKPDHVIQAAAYRQILSNQGYAVHPKVILFYTNKQYQYMPNRVYKEFHVQVDGSRWESQVQEAFATNLENRERILRGELPERVCENERSILAKDCPVWAACFSEHGNHGGSNAESAEP